MKCSLLDYVHFGWSARLVDGLKPHPSPLSSQNSEMLIFVFIQHLMLARLVNGFEPHPLPLSSQKHKMLIFWLYSTSDDQLGWSMDDQPGWSMDSNPILHLSPAKTVKCSFLYYIQHLMLARLVNVHLLMISQAVRWTQTSSTTPLQPKT